MSSDLLFVHRALLTIYEKVVFMSAVWEYEEDIRRLIRLIFGWLCFLFYCPFSAVFSAAAAHFSIQILLSFLTLCLTSLFLALYSCLLLCFNRSNLAPSILVLPLSFRYFFSIFCLLCMACSALLCFCDHSITFFEASLYVSKILSCSPSASYPGAFYQIRERLGYLFRARCHGKGEEKDAPGRLRFQNGGK